MLAAAISFAVTKIDLKCPKLPNAVILNAVGRRNTQMGTKVREQKQCLW